MRASSRGLSRDLFVTVDQSILQLTGELEAKACMVLAREMGR
jgi:hypothetical protein